jgi:hypothetical protein
MDAGFVDDLVVISRPNLPVFPVFFPVIRKFEFGDWFESDCIVSQTVQSLEIFSLMSRESPPLAGLLLLGRSLWVPNLISLRPTVPKISAHLGHYGRFLEKRPRDSVRPYCVTGLPVQAVRTVRIPVCTENLIRID